MAASLNEADDERAYIVQMVQIYREAALVQLVEAEECAVRAMELRENAMALMGRALHIASEFARTAR